MTARPALAAALVAAALVGCDGETFPFARGRVEATDTHTRTLVLEGRELVLDGFAGRVTLREVPRSDDRVVARFTRRARGATLASAADRLHGVGVDEAGDGALYQFVWRTTLAAGASVDADVAVPPGTRIVVRLGEGALAAEGLTGGLDAEVGSGPVELSRHAAPATRVHTGRGPVRLTASAVPADATWTLSTEAGPVRLVVPTGAGLVLDAQTGAGRFVVPPLGGETRTESPDGTRLRGTLGGGGASITLRSGLGSVHVRQREM